MAWDCSTSTARSATTGRYRATSLTVYLPSRRATMVVLLNSDMSPPQAELSTLVGEAITKVITPRHVYELSAAVQVPHPE
jgi:D-alanyl-D-alanine carboxypeptidase